MPPWVLLVEIALLTVIVCGLHALKPRLGLAPLYLAVGLIETFLFVAGKYDGDGNRIAAQLFFGEVAGVSFALFLPALLTTMVLVYVLEGTREARRFLLGLGILYVLHGGVDLILEMHANHPPPGLKNLGDSVLVEHKLSRRLASMGAMATDFVVIVVVYQFLINRLKRLPLAIPLFAALVAAMVNDSVVYTLLRGRLLDVNELWMLQKIQAGVVAGGTMAMYLAWQLRRNEEQLQRGVMQRSALDFIDLRRRVAEIQAQLEAQKEQLTYLRETFGRYVSNDVVDTLMENPDKLQLGGEVRNVTILFADIRSYSTLAESLGPTEIIGMLNRYFTAVTKVILDNKGMINEFEGDAVLAVFGAPLHVENHAELAMTSALGMLDRVRDLNAEFEHDGTAARWRAIGVDGLAIRIGLHTGEVVAGNIGSEVRTKYAVIGDTVNIASRVEGLNKPLHTSLLLTEQTRKHIVGTSSVVPPMVDMGTHAVKGRQEPVRVFTVENAYPTFNN